MKRAPIRSLIAQDWPFKGYLLLCSVISLVWAIYTARPTLGLLLSPNYLFSFLIVIVTFPVLGFFVGVLTSGILCPLYEIQERRNGWPIKRGDYVQILAGPYRGRVARASFVWYGDRRGVEVPINQKDKGDVTVTFQPWEILKVNDEPPDAYIDRSFLASEQVKGKEE